MKGRKIRQYKNNLQILKILFLTIILIEINDTIYQLK